jgi:hypothetical protein
MLLVGGRVVDAVHTEKLLLVFAIKCDEVRVEQTLLRKLILVTDCV